MSSLVQTLIVALIVLGALGFVGRKLWRTMHPAKAAGCDAGCGCGGETASNDWAKT